MEELLRLARELRPTALDDHGLEAALRTQVERFGSETGVRATLDLAAGLDDAIDEDEQTVVYRVVQESLSNVAQHAGRSAVHVEVRRRDRRAVVRVIDDGCGFDNRRPSRARPRGHARARAARRRPADGHSAPGRGTTVELASARPARASRRRCRAAPSSSRRSPS